MSFRFASTAAAAVKPVRSLRGGLRSLADAAVSPLTLDDVLDHFHPLRRTPPESRLRGRVVSVTPETAESATLVIRPGKGWLGHVPGQYLQVGVDVDGVRQWRSYSLTHGPRPDGNISITVKAIPGGIVSGHLVRRTRSGHLLQLAQADGAFVLQSPLPAKLLLITAGSGITPVIGMLRNLFSKRTPPATDIVLVHAAITRPAAIFGAEMRRYAEAGRLRLIERYKHPDGLLTTAALAADVPDFAERTAYACGPAGLLDTLEAFYAERGLRLHTERFRPVLVTAGADGEGGPVSFARSNVVVDSDGSSPILDSAEAAGVLMPSGCRIGICMGCVLPMTSGALRDLRNGAVTVVVPGESQPGGVRVQTCINAAAGPCNFDH